MERNRSEREIERLFIAVKIPPNLSELLEKESKICSAKLKFAKWTHSEDYHITLQFLGDTPVKEIPALLKALKEISGKSKPFRLSLENWGTFGLPHAPKVLWAGVSGELARLAELQRDVVNATSGLGFKAEAREYNPHITLARRYRGEQPFSAEQLQDLRDCAGEKENNCSEKDWTVDAFVVYATRMHAIPMYEMIEKLTFF
jgi:RNA 2',3'-cyclic 3'-phosphodiesterase